MVIIYSKNASFLYLAVQLFWVVKNMLAKLKAAGFDGFIATVEAEQEEAPKQEAKPEAPKVTLKSIDEIAREVIRGNWGNGQDRVNRLKAAGYDPKKVQDRVNELC